MKIGELSRLVGVEIETIRYYEKIGVLSEPSRNPNGYRAYGQRHLEQLAFVRHCRALDIPLSEIRQLLEFVADTSAGCESTNAIIDIQLNKVRARLQSMQALEQQLLKLRMRCGALHADGEACGIMKELISAAHGEACACHREG